MSREFGEYLGGYFHEKISNAADDCRGGDTAEITKLWGQVLCEFYPIAYAISAFEAADSGVYYPIMETMSRLNHVQDALDAIKRYIEPFQSVADKAVREHIKAKEGQG